MMWVKVTFIFLFCVFNGSSSTINETEQYTPQISAILKHLNSNANKIYDYKNGIFINSQQKADIVEVTVDVEVACTVNYPGVPCTEQVLTCDGFLQYVDNEYRVLSDVLCRPKRDSSIENSDEHIPPLPTPSAQESKFELSHEAVSSEQNADFVAVKADSVPCVGCPFDLNTDVEGVSSLVETALKHIESERAQKQNALRVIRLQQQVVAGIKYILTVEVAPTLCQKGTDSFSTDCPVNLNAGSSVCEIIFLQKPWINKEKSIISNNCTISQEYTIDSKRDTSNDMSNEISTNPYTNKPNYDDSNRKPAVQNKIKGQLDPHHLADLESQILFVESENTKPVLRSSIESSSTYPKRVQYKDVIVENPSYNQFYTDSVQNSAKYEPLVPAHDQSGILSTPFTIDKNDFTVVDQSDISTSVRNENHADQVVSHTSTAVNSQTDNLKQDMSGSLEDNLGVDEDNTVKIRKQDNGFQEISRPQRDIENSPIEQNYRRFVRELKSATSLDSSGSQESNSKENTSEVSIRKRDLENTSSHSSESKEDNSKENTSESSTRKSGLENTSSHSSESKEDNNKNGTSEETTKKSDTENTSSHSSESKEDNGSDSSSEELAKPIVKRNVDITNSHSSVSEDDNTGESIRSKRNIALHFLNVRVKRKNGDDDDNSSSSSSSSESKAKEDKKSKKDEKNDNDNNDNSSSSSSDDKSEKSRKNNKKNNDEKDSDSSSSSSENTSREENEVRTRDGTNRDVNVDINISRVKRSVGQLEKISQEEKFLVRDLADFAASSLDSIDDDNHKRVILQILGAKKLKLDGIYYHMTLRLGISHCSENEEDENCREKLFTNLTKICKVLVHVENDLSNPKVVKSQCQNIKKDDRDRNRTNYSRYRRNLLVGGPSNIPVDDPRILEFTRNTLSNLDSQSEYPNSHKLIKIVSATSQVVAGAKYQIEVIISLSKCLKTDKKEFEDCDTVEDASFKSCHIEIWDRPWLNLRHTTVKCNDSDAVFHFENENPRRVRSISNEIFLNKEDSDKPANTKDSSENLGVIEKESADNLKASRYLKDILTYLDNESGHYNKLKIDDIISVDKQVVAGELWRIKAEVTLSDCPQGTSTDPQLCNKLEGSESRTCVFKIWDRPWLPNGREVQTTCGNESKPYSFRLKRSILGSKYVIPSSLNTHNEPNPKVLQHVKTGLQYLDFQSNHETKYMIKSIKKVSKQTVAGSLWHVKAEIILSDCPKQFYTEHCEELQNSEGKTCIFTIWERSWLSAGTQINITCDGDENLYSLTPNTLEHAETPHTSEHLVKFSNFLVKYNKTYYNRSQHNYRLKVFTDNLNTIDLLNKYEQGTARYGITQFADLTAAEFSKSHGLRSDLRNENEIPFSNAVIPDMDIPTEFDWREKGAVTEVKNQQSCGSCWAFSTTGNIEGQYAIKYGKLLEFSEQELVDCDKLDQGCNGGLMDNAYRIIEEIGGLETESDYPYDAEDEKCHFNKSKVRVQLSGALNISHNEDDMAKWLVKNGPISIAINANAMQFYMGGISHPWKMLCNPNNLDHGVLIVGYGVHDYPRFNKTLPYWIVKNSWGSSWGEQGYYRVYRGDGTCGLNQTPSSGIVV